MFYQIRNFVDQYRFDSIYTNNIFIHFFHVAIIQNFEVVMIWECFFTSDFVIDKTPTKSFFFEKNKPCGKFARE